MASPSRQCRAWRSCAIVVVSCCIWGAAEVSTAAPATPGGAIRAYEVQQWQDRISREPALAGTAVTIIVEADPGAVISSLIKHHGGTLRFVKGRWHEVTDRKSVV